MPGQSKEKKDEAHEEEMDQESPENEDSSDEESGSSTGSEEEEEDSSDMNEEDYERRRTECLSEMSDLERQFSDLKEQLYRERISQVDAKLEEVKTGKASEYLEPLAALQQNMQIRTEVAGVYKEFCLTVVKHKYECELQGARQHLESEKLLLYDTVQNELEEKIRRLEEDRQNVDITSELWGDELRTKKKKKFDPFNPEKRKKPVTVTDILLKLYYANLYPGGMFEDWTTIKKITVRCFLITRNNDKHQYSARFEEGRLFYEGDWYGRGHSIIIDTKDDSPMFATITAINTLEVWIKRSDNSKSKLYISQLQKGKYTIRHA
ncbi:unnamed protein product [Lampetra planeri]